MQKGLITFCCLSYNHSKYIEECIKSIWNQDYKNIEIIALDDGSSDNSAEILTKLQGQSPCPMKVILQENSGCIGANFNKMIKEANGEFIAFIACDDSFIQNTIKNKIDLLLNDNNLVFVCDSKINHVNGEGHKVDFPKMSLEDIKKPTAKDILKLDYEKIHSYYIQGAIYRKSLIDTVNGFDNDMICDDIILRTKISKYLIKHPKLSFKVLNKEGVNYRHHTSNISSNSIRQIKGVSQYMKKYHKKPSFNFLFWVLACIKEDENYRELYKYFNKLNILRDYIEVFKTGVLYKTNGIPFVLQLKKYKDRHGKKHKYLIIFGFKIEISG